MKTEFTLDSASFHRLNANAAVLGSKATTSFFLNHNLALYVFCGDGQLYFQDWTGGNRNPHDVYDDMMWVQDYATTKGIAAHLDKVEGDMSFTLVDDTLQVNELEFTVSNGEMISEANVLEKFGDLVGTQPFAVNADRLRKISLLQPRDYPVDFKHVFSKVTRTPILLFKKGPYLKGAYSLLDRQLIKGADGSDQHLWR